MLLVRVGLGGLLGEGPRSRVSRCGHPREAASTCNAATTPTGCMDVRVLLERGDLRWPDLWETLEPVGA